jgi:beta-phosphoglucomutase family hydrolase
MNREQPVIDLSLFDAVIFDMDGVVTDTASVHASAWKSLFDGYLSERARASGESFHPFDIHDDYLKYIDGKPRYEGVRDFLASRDIELPDGDPSDPPGKETVAGLGNRKNGLFLDRLQQEGARPYSSTVTLVHRLTERNIKTAIISASRNMEAVLESAGLSDLFDERVDGVLAGKLGLAGKPDPAVFLEAARRLEIDPARAVVVEDALAGVEAGRRGAFGFVIGVDRGGQATALSESGADVVVPDLEDVQIA